MCEASSIEPKRRWYAPRTGAAVPEVTVVVDRQTRMKNKKFRRTPGGNTHIHYSRHERAYAECAVTGKKLHGTSDQTKSKVRAHPKSARRPSVKFGGVLSAPPRKELWEHVALVEAGRKKMEEVPAKLKKFISQLKVKA